MRFSVGGTSSSILLPTSARPALQTVAGESAPASKLSREKRSHKIDLLIALAMAARWERSKGAAKNLFNRQWSGAEFNSMAGSRTNQLFNF